MMLCSGVQLRWAHRLQPSNPVIPSAVEESLAILFL